MAFKPGTARAFSRGSAGRSGRSIRKNAKILTIMIFMGVFALLAVCSRTM